MSQTRMLLASGAGFTPELHDVARRLDVILVDAERLYHGD